MGETAKNPLEEVLKKIIGGISDKGNVTEEGMADAWRSAAGAKAAAHSKPRSLKSGRLVVNVDGSSWLYELTVKKREILKNLKEALKDKKVKEITFRIGDIK
jgi:predicted nucleic acid-binding Zn ribbon protein